MCDEIYSSTNIVAAEEVGIVGLLFKGADSLRRDLSQLGIDVAIAN